MPWNCLCSSEKQRHKLEISAPILDRDDKRNTKIIKNPTKYSNQKLINAPLQGNVNQVEIVTGSDCPQDGKLRSSKSSTKQRSKKNNAKNAKDSHAPKIQSGEQQSPNDRATANVNFSTDTIDPNLNASALERTEPEEDDTTYSQLIFERSVSTPGEPSSDSGLPTNGVNTLTATKTVAAQREDPNTGHYDRLPFDKSSQQSVLPPAVNVIGGDTNGNHKSVYTDQRRPTTPSSHGQQKTSATYSSYYQGNQNSTPATGGGGGFPSADAIPFIDEEDIVSIVEKHSPLAAHLRINEANDNNNNNNSHYASTSSRIITLHPKNVGSSHTIQRANTLQRLLLSNKNSEKSDAFSRQSRAAITTTDGEIVIHKANRSVEVVQRSLATAPDSAANQLGRIVGVHEFFSWNPAKGKLCQICHAPVLNAVVKCRSCDLVCHLWCVPRITPSVRYHDTSFLIYRKWLRAEDELAFPTIHKYVLSSVKSEDNISKPDYYLTDSECTYSNVTEKRIDLDAVNRNKRKSRRRTRSLEKRKPTAPNGEDNATERFIGTSPNDAKNNELRLRASENKISIRVEASDDASKGHQHQQNELSKVHTIKAEEQGTGASSEAVAETSDESDDFGSKGSCYDAAAVSGSVVKSQNQQQSDGDLISVDVHPEPRPQSGVQQNNLELAIIEPCDVKATKESVPAISDKNKLRKVLVERQISCTSDESASESYPQAKFYSPNRRSSSLRSSVRSATSATSSNFSANDRISDADDGTSLDSAKALQKSNEDRVDSSQQIHPKKLETQPWPIQTSPSPSQHQKGAPSSNLRLHYVTERILAYILPAQNGSHLGAHDQYEKEVIPMLEQKHGKNYKLFNLETCISVITLERICELCKHIDKWLGSGQEKVVVLQDRDDCQRLGATIIAFLEYLRICASNYQTRNITLNEDSQAHNTIARNFMNLDMFSMKKFLEGNIEPLRIPSYKRYIRYFSGLLSGQIKLNSSALHLNYISIESPPSWLQYNGMSSKSEWNSFIKIYEGLQCVYTSDIHIIPITTRQFLYQIGNLRLRGDILIRCYQISSTDGNYSRESRTLLFSVQFHTCAIKTDDVVFVKEDLDYAHGDPRFPNDCKVSLHFNSGANNNFLFQSPLIRTERVHDLAKANSIEHLDLNSCHTQGPLDGSLYATILKSPKSSHCPTNLNESSNNNNNQFGFDKSFDSIFACQPINTSTPVKSASRTETVSSKTSFREASVPLTRSDYTTHIDSRPGTSQSNYRQHSGHPPSTTTSHHQTSSTFIQTNQSPDNRINQNGSREFVRSPLTLSMDSGISSSGVLNRPTLASSVSPSSFPSQVSPQEDRHRELDDILSDMLSTVQDIPDYQNRKPSTHSVNQYGRSQSVVSHVSATASASSPVYTLPIPNPPAHNNSNRDRGEAIHRSHSYVSQENVQRLSSNSNSNPYKQDRFDPYDTASTTTTLTPPPSESGRETPNPFSGYHSSTSNISLMQSRQQPRRDTSGQTMPSQHNQVNPGQANSQHQSTIYQRVVRTSNESHPIAVSPSEDEDNIPYHAREHSQPFTYGNLPSNGIHLNEVSGPDNNQQKDPRMIKAQSGLTSPMLVRKTFGTSSGGPTTDFSTLRKTPTRNDFEEMLRERREKVMSEKYSISDKQPIASNGYHNYYNDPLKRSNTLDGFHRSNSSTEISGQTWLQLQQQKLRAKKNQQLTDGRKCFDEIHTEIKNRSLRSRNNVRYDGYASDTAAFDEVDYRRPLHVQTPYHTTNSSPERHYHTISTTTKTVTKERPFVAVKRSHETAKQEQLGSPSLSPLAILNASPLGHIAQAQQSNNIRNSNNNNNNSNGSNGLLSLAESSFNNGRARLEFDNKTNVHTDTLTNARACANSHNNNNNLNTDVSLVISNHVITDNNNSSNAVNPRITDSKTIIDYKTTDLSNNIHNNNICYAPNNNKTPYHANAEVSKNHIHQTDSTKSQNTSINGQSALEELLATLAVEKDLMDQQLMQNKQQQNGNASESSSVHKESLSNQKANQELSDVIADLTEFTRFESQRVANGFGDSLSNNSSDSSNGSNVNNTQKRLLSESDQSSSISPSPSDRSNHLALWNEQVREESFSSYRSETDQDISIAGSPRPETPAFPVTPRTPYGFNNGSISPSIPPRSPTPQRRDIYTGAQKGLFQEVSNQNDTIYRNRMNSIGSNANSEPHEVDAHLVKFVRDSSKFWYKPNLSREEAIHLLRNAPPGTFIVRDSTTFKNAYGLVVRVAQPPPGVTASSGSDELVRHFLVEPTTRGVRLKGCANEPVFTSLSALVYQHSITPLALQCRLIIPDSDIQRVDMHTPAQKQLLTQGAACNVLYLYSCGTESLTGDEAVRRAVAQLFSLIPLPKPTEVHFKVAHQGITLTDNTRQKFFRKHYTAQNISFCGTDPDHRQWSVRTEEGGIPVSNKTIFAFVARRSPSSKDNQCHVFCDLAVAQPATAIVSFANKMLPTEKQINRNI